VVCLTSQTPFPTLIEPIVVATILGGMESSMAALALAPEVHVYTVCRSNLTSGHRTMTF